MIGELVADAGLFGISAVGALVLILVAGLAVLPLVLVLLAANTVAVIFGVLVFLEPARWLERRGHQLLPGLLRAMSWPVRLWLWGGDVPYLFSHLPLSMAQLQRLAPGHANGLWRDFLYGAARAVWWPLRVFHITRLPAINVMQPLPRVVTHLMTGWLLYDGVVTAEAVGIVLMEWGIERAVETLEHHRRTRRNAGGAIPACVQGDTIQWRYSSPPAAEPAPSEGRDPES